MNVPFIVPNAEPFFLPGGSVGCLLLHGFSSMPEEMRELGHDLARRGYSVLALRLAGHATHPSDLRHIQAQDWLITVEEGLALLRGTAQQIFVIGQSLGGNLTLLSAALYPISGAVALSTAYPSPLSHPKRLVYHLFQLLRPTIRKQGPTAHPTLGVRREANYPAYVEYPTRSLWEPLKIQEMMRDALSQVQVPVLIIHSRDDLLAPPWAAQRIYEELGSTQKELVWLDGFDHAVVYHPRRQEVFEVIADFISRTASAVE